MNKFTFWFCRAILYLNHIPRYGRIYAWQDGDIGGPEWRFRKNGYWGVNILDNMGLLWKYIDYNNPEIEPWLDEMNEKNN